MDENYIEDVVLPPPPPLNMSPVEPMTLIEYEMGKLQNVKRNNEKLKELGVPALVVGLTYAVRIVKEKSKKKIKMRDEDEYVQEGGDQSEDDVSEIFPKKTQKRKKKVLLMVQLLVHELIL